MYYLHDTPVDPFAQPKTKIELGVDELQKSVWTGIGMSIGLSVGGFLFWLAFGRKG